MKTKLISSRQPITQSLNLDEETRSPFNSIASAIFENPSLAKFDKAVDKTAVRILTPVFESKTMDRIDKFVNKVFTNICDRLFGLDGY